MIRATLDDLTHRLPCGIYQIGDGDGWASISDDPKTIRFVQASDYPDDYIRDDGKAVILRKNLYPPFDSGE